MKRRFVIAFLSINLALSFVVAIQAYLATQGNGILFFMSILIVPLAVLCGFPYLLGGIFRLFKGKLSSGVITGWVLALLFIAVSFAGNVMM